MRRTGLVVLILAAVLFCTLVAGTPVNMDPSPEAQIAGIHLTTPPSVPRTAPGAVGSVFALWLVAVTTVIGAHGARGAQLATRRADPGGSAPRSLLRSRSGTRRGPPSVAS